MKGVEPTRLLYLERLMRDVVHDVFENVRGTSVQGLLADPHVHVGEAIAETSNIEGGMIQFDAVVRTLGYIVVVNIDLFGVGKGIDPIAESGYPIVANDVSRALDLHPPVVLNAAFAGPRDPSL